MASKHGLPIEKYLEVSGECKRELFHVRSRRPRPNLDDKVIVSWNGLAISSFARASNVLRGEAEGTRYSFPVVGHDSKEYMEVAEKAATFIRKHLYDENSQVSRTNFFLIEREAAILTRQGKTLQFSYGKFSCCNQPHKISL